jgi:hypothetical protein
MSVRTTTVSLVTVAAMLTVAPRLRSVALQVAHDDQLHYAGHLLAGRVLSLCPCTVQLAEMHYAKGMFHARTPREEALLTSDRPTTWRARLIEAPRLIAATLRRLG